MFTLVLKNTKAGTEERMEFASAKLAQIYKDYQINFGQWNQLARWIRADKITPDLRMYICDEMTQIDDGEMHRYYQVADGLVIEGYVGSKDDCFAAFRFRRNKALEATDWSQMADVQLSQDKRKLYRDYRTYLRNLPGLHNELSILSAEVYSFEDWQLGKR